MLKQAQKKDPTLTREILYRTKGHGHGPITRLVSPGDLGQIIKPFVFLDFFTVETQMDGGMGYHPHSGIVTVTTIFEGGITYEDSTNKSGKLVSGSVEWMQAGSGVWHTGGPLPEAGDRIRGMQLWLAMPAEIENTPPVSLYINPDEIQKVGPARVIIGDYKGISSPLPQIAPITYLHVNLDDGEQWNFDIPDSHDVLWVAVDQGQLETEGATLAKEIAVFSHQPGQLTVKAKGKTNFVLGSAVKHPYPLVTGYYSVHTTPNDLQIGENGIRKVAQRLKAEGKI